MGCIYSNFEGECSMWDEDFPIDNMGCDEEGICVCEEDPDPSYTCESYQSDGNELDDEEV